MTFAKFCVVVIFGKINAKKKRWWFIRLWLGSDFHCWYILRIKTSHIHKWRIEAVLLLNKGLHDEIPASVYIYLFDFLEYIFSENKIIRWTETCSCFGSEIPAVAVNNSIPRGRSCLIIFLRVVGRILRNNHELLVFIVDWIDLKFSNLSRSFTNAGTKLWPIWFETSMPNHTYHGLSISNPPLAGAASRRFHKIVSARAYAQQRKVRAQRAPSSCRGTPMALLLRAGANSTRCVRRTFSHQHTKIFSHLF